MSHLIRTMKIAVKYSPPKLLRQNYIHSILLLKRPHSEVDWYESRAIHWSYVGVKLEKLKLRTAPKHFHSVIFWRVGSQIIYTVRNKKITLTPAIELFVIYNYRNETRILFSKLQIFLLLWVSSLVMETDGWIHQGQILISAVIM